MQKIESPLMEDGSKKVKKKKLIMKKQKDGIQKMVAVNGVHQTKKKKLGLLKQKIKAEKKIIGDGLDKIKKPKLTEEKLKRKKKVKVEGGMKLKVKKQLDVRTNQEGKDVQVVQSDILQSAKDSVLEVNQLQENNGVQKINMKYKKLLNICKNLQDNQRKKQSSLNNKQLNFSHQLDRAEMAPVSNDRCDNTVPKDQDETQYSKLNMDSFSLSNHWQGEKEEKDTEINGDSVNNSSFEKKDQWPRFQRQRFGNQQGGRGFQNQGRGRGFFQRTRGRGGFFPRGEIDSVNHIVLQKERRYGNSNDTAKDSGQSLLRPSYLLSHLKNASGCNGPMLYPSMKVKEMKDQVGVINDLESDTAECQPLPSWLKQKGTKSSGRGRKQGFGDGQEHLSSEAKKKDCEEKSLLQPSYLLNHLKNSSGSNGSLQMKTEQQVGVTSDQGSDSARSQPDPSGLKQRGTGSSNRGTQRSGRGMQRSGRGMQRSGRGMQRSGRGMQRSGRGTQQGYHGQQQHPSWEAKRNSKGSIVEYQGKKIIFDA